MRSVELRAPKSKRHYVGLTWAAGDEKGGVIAGLEGVTGKKAANSDAMTVKN